MKILILGGTGRTGVWTLSEALQRGHQVHALVRDKTKVTIEDEKLTLFEGTPTDKAILSEAMKGCEAVLSSLNISRKSDFPWSKLRTPKDFLAKTITNIVDLTEQQGIKRVVIISAAGVGDSKAVTPGWFMWLINNSNIGHAYAGHEQQEKILAKSSLDWTAVRPVGLTNSTKDKNVRVSLNGKPRPSMMISRRNTAKFLLDLIEQGLYIKTCPVISEQ